MLGAAGKNCAFFYSWEPLRDLARPLSIARADFISGRRKGYADAVDMSNDEALNQYDTVLAEAKELMLRKNHDYGEAWREMSKEGIIDMILAKIIRIKTILAHDGKTIASEGVEGNYFDIINYAIFDLIHYEN